MSAQECQPYIDGAVAATTEAVVTQFTGVIHCLANNILGSVFVSAHFIQVIYHVVLFPITFSKLYSSYKDYKRGAINKNLFGQTMLFIFFFVAETICTVAMAVVHKVEQVDNCTTPSETVMKLPQLLTFFCSSSLFCGKDDYDKAFQI
eukprot:Awhi_evm1s3194